MAAIQPIALLLIDAADLRRGRRLVADDALLRARR